MLDQLLQHKVVTGFAPLPLPLLCFGLSVFQFHEELLDLVFPQTKGIKPVYLGKS